MDALQVFIGWDPREKPAWQVCARSLAAHTDVPPPIAPIGIATLGATYARPWKRHKGRLIDIVSHAPMATEFALARFWVPVVASAQWALFCDADFLWRADVQRLAEQADPRFAVQVVKHPRQPVVDSEKMDGQIQTPYERKNWSSLVLWNMRHAGNRRLWAEDLNGKKGLWLHQFGWLRDDEIGALDVRWNVLDTGREPEIAEGTAPFAYHYTRGTPDMLAAELPYSREWWGHLTAAEINACEATRKTPWPHPSAPARCATAS